MSSSQGIKFVPARIEILSTSQFISWTISRLEMCKRLYGTNFESAIAMHHPASHHPSRMCRLALYLHTTPVFRIIESVVHGLSSCTFRSRANTAEPLVKGTGAWG